jgi:hypothetical protein
VTNIAPFTGAHTTAYAYAFGSNNSRHSVTNTAGNAMNFYYSFKNIQTYDGANAILVNYEGGYVSAVTLTYRLAIYNFTLSSWENLYTAAPAITASGASTDQFNYLAKVNISLADYVSGGEARVRVFSTVTGTQTFQTDQIALVIGSVNADAGLGETSFGQTGSGDASSTRDIMATTTAANNTGNLWKTSTCKNNTAPCATAPYGSDWGGTWNTNFSAASNVSVPITVPSGASVTGIHYAARFRSAATTPTYQLGLRDYSGQFAGPTIAGGWTAVGATNAAVTFTFTSSIPLPTSGGPYQVNPEDYIDTVNNRGNLRLRTSASTATATTTREWDFAFMSIRWVAPSGGAAAPTLAGYTNSTEAALNYSASCTDCGARIGAGAPFRQTIVISGAGFGVVSAGNRASAANKIEVVGAATDIIADGNVTDWTDTAITFLTDTAVSGNADSDWGTNFGGASALKVTAGGLASNALNFYLFPQVTSISVPTVTADAAREYDAGDSDGVITLNGTRFGTASTSGWVRVLGCDAASCSSPTGSATTTSWSNTAITVQVPIIIADNAYTGSLAMQQGTGGNNKQDIYTASGFRILPRIIGFNPTNGEAGDAVTVNGNHFCQYNDGTCPGAFNATSSVTFLNGVDATAFSGWTDTAITTAVPPGAVTGNATTTSNGYASNGKLFTVNSSIPNAPTSANQFRNSGLTDAIAVGAYTSSTPAYFTMTMSANGSGGTLYPQIEIDPIGTAFSCSSGVCAQANEGDGVAGVGPVDCANPANNCAIASSTANGSFHWQARVRRNKGGTDYYSPWVPFGGNGDPNGVDFILDTIAPAISNIASSTTDSTATVTWDTAAEQSSSQVQYNTDNNFNDDCAVNNDCTTIDWSYVTSHLVNIGSLDVNTLYYFRVRSRDQANNETKSAVYTFRTAGAQTPITGDLTSLVFDTASSSDGPAYNSIMWQGALAPGNKGHVRFQLAASATSSGPWNFIGGTTCSSGDWFDPGAPDTPAEIGCYSYFNNLRYFKYKIQLCSDDCIVQSTSSPRVDDVIINWSP